MCEKQLKDLTYKLINMCQNSENCFKGLFASLQLLCDLSTLSQQTKSVTDTSRMKIFYCDESENVFPPSFS